jgi:hypothetical protein
MDPYSQRYHIKSGTRFGGGRISHYQGPPKGARCYPSRAKGRERVARLEEKSKYIDIMQYTHTKECVVSSSKASSSRCSNQTQTKDSDKGKREKSFSNAQTGLNTRCRPHTRGRIEEKDNFAAPSSPPLFVNKPFTFPPSLISTSSFPFSSPPASTPDHVTKEKVIKAWFEGRRWLTIWWLFFFFFF